MTRPLTRRDWLSVLASLAVATAAPRAVALGRKPHGGVLRLRLPWPLDVLDPHAVDDPAAALFGPAMSDPLFALDASGRPYPALAQALPELVKGGLRVLTRPNLLSALGKPMDARDVLWSLSRAERAGAAALLAPVGKPTPDPGDAQAILFPAGDALGLATTLSSPLTAILPRTFSRSKPDGTGAFLAELGRDSLVLRRNLNAARGASYLDRVEVRVAADLKDALRAFEASETDASWLGEFLHSPRPGAVKYDAGPIGWVVLRTGKDAGTWGAPGVAQKLLDALPSGRLTHLGLTNASGGAGGDPAWGGDAGEIVVPDSAAHLEAIGNELAAIFSRPGHELRVAARPRRELEYRRDQGRYVMMLDFVRPVGTSASAASLGLHTAAGPNLAKKPPGGLSSDPRDAARSLSLGVVGQLRASGAHVGALHELAAWDLGAVWRR